MKRRAVVLSPQAREDLIALYDLIAASSSEVIAADYLDRLEAYLNGFDLASERGSARDDIRLGLRVVGFERRITIAFDVTETHVTILRMFYGGRDWATDFGKR